MADLASARALAVCRIPNPDEREIVYEWCDRYRLGCSDGRHDAETGEWVAGYSDAEILVLAVRLWCEGAIDDVGGQAQRPFRARPCPPCAEITP